MVLVADLYHSPNIRGSSRLDGPFEVRLQVLSLGAVG